MLSYNVYQQQSKYTTVQYTYSNGHYSASYIPVYRFKNITKTVKWKVCNDDKGKNCSSPITINSFTQNSNLFVCTSNGIGILKKQSSGTYGRSYDYNKGKNYNTTSTNVGSIYTKNNYTKTENGVTYYYQALPIVNTTVNAPYSGGYYYFGNNKLIR